MPRTYFVSALGCKVNQYEAQQIRETLDRLGLQPVAAGQVPDVAILNTCAVTVTALRKSRQLVRRWSRPGRTQVIVVGCGAAADTDRFRRIEGVTAVIGHEDDLLAHLSEALCAGGPVAPHPCGTEEDGAARRNRLSISPVNPSSTAEGCLSNRHDQTATTLICSSKMKETPSTHGSIKTKAPEGEQVKWDLCGTVHRLADHQRAFLKVQDGCDAGCTYCVIPQVRPRLRSKPIEVAVHEAGDLVAAGHKEIVVTGVCLGAYGRPTARRDRLAGRGAGILPARSGHRHPTAGGTRIDVGPEPLASLIQALAAVPGLLRIRLSSLEPWDVTDEFLVVMAREATCAPHLHLPLQAGSDAILRRMNRQYRIEEYLATVRRVKQALDRPAITTDIIVGFPGETDEQFDETLKVVEEVGYARVHAFPFSLRAGTAAARWKNEVLPRRVIQDRMRRLQSLADKVVFDYRRQFVGQTARVIIESPTPEGWQGRTERYFPVTFAAPPEPDLRSRVAQVLIETTAGQEVFGRLEGLD
jgi:threonylcarbamoyladenosine tRNA methylthiotransferase MtaB